MANEIKQFQLASYPNDLLVNCWINHGIKITMVDNDKNPFVNLANKQKIIELRDLLTEVINSME